MSRMQDDTQTIEQSEVGKIDAVFGSSLDPDGGNTSLDNEVAGAAEVEPAPKPETALETIQRAQDYLDNALTFARTKCDAAVEKVEAAGGVLSPAMQEAVDKLRATIAGATKA